MIVLCPLCVVSLVSSVVGRQHFDIFVRSRGHIFSLIVMKLGQKVCPDKISDEFGNGSCRVKN